MNERKIQEKERQAEVKVRRNYSMIKDVIFLL